MARDRLIARRKSLGFTQLSLAHAVGCQRSTVARWEHDENEVAAWHREPLAEALQWTLSELGEALGGASTMPQGVAGWWSNFVLLEQSATVVRAWHPVLIPGLLQTEEYASALLRDRDLVIRRLDRQRMITRPGDPVELVAVVDESTLRRPIGGPDVLAGQLTHLATMGERPNVSVFVLPLDAPAQPADWGAFLLLQFRWPGGLAYVQHADGATYLDSPAQIASHHRTFERLRELAQPFDLETHGVST